MNPQVGSGAIGTSSGSIGPMPASAPQQSLPMAMQPSAIANAGGAGTGTAARAARPSRCEHAGPAIPSQRREPLIPLDDNDDWLTTADRLESVSTAPGWVKQVAELLDVGAFQLIMTLVGGNACFFVVKKNGWSGYVRNAETRATPMLPHHVQLTALPWKWFYHQSNRIELARHLEKDSDISDYCLELKGRMTAIRQPMLGRTVFETGPQSLRDKQQWTMLYFEVINMMLDLDLHVEARILRLQQ